MFGEKSQGFRTFLVPGAAVACLPMRDFVGEQYLPASDLGAVERCVRAAREATKELTLEGTRVRYIRSIFVPEDETCMHMYRADSVEAVQAAAARASLRLERIAEAIVDAGASDH
jgi:Protein of unknown function (DUF4242)